MPLCDFLRAPVVWRRGCCAKRVQNGVIKKRPFDGLRSPRCVFRRGEKVARPTLPRPARPALGSPGPLSASWGFCCTSLADARTLSRKVWRWRGFGEDGWGGGGPLRPSRGGRFRGRRVESWRRPFSSLVMRTGEGGEGRWETVEEEEIPCACAPPACPCACRLFEMSARQAGRPAGSSTDRNGEGEGEGDRRRPCFVFRRTNQIGSDQIRSDQHTARRGEARGCFEHV